MCGASLGDLWPFRGTPLCCSHVMFADVLGGQPIPDASPVQHNDDDDDDDDDGDDGGSCVRL